MFFHSKNHTHLDSCPTCSEYWDFGLPEQAIFDYSAVIDYLLNNTQSSQLDFIGYSMGTTQVIYDLNFWLYMFNIHIFKKNIHFTVSHFTGRKA